MCNEEVAANYNQMKLQIQNLKKKMVQNPEYDNLSWDPQPVLPSNLYIKSSWCLPYPPPNFQIVIHTNSTSISDELNRQKTFEEIPGNTPTLPTEDKEADDPIFAEDKIEKRGNAVSDLNSFEKLSKELPEVGSEVVLQVSGKDQMKTYSNLGFEVEDQRTDANANTKKTLNKETDFESNIQLEDAHQVESKNVVEFEDLVSIVENFDKKKQYEETEGSEYATIGVMKVMINVLLILGSLFFLFFF